ncbi:MAG: nitrous oxide reductase accessory protein NosL [Bacillus sp. (in: firmicutes)]
MKKMLISICILIGLTGCGNESSFEPEEIDPEVDVCEICNMSITEGYYATQLIASDGKVFKFDDLGCMAEYVDEHGLTEDDIAREYVRDIDNGEWIEAKDAAYAYHEDFWTPMAYGVVSFEDEEKARSYIEEQGKGEILSYADLADHEWGWME